jgi:hypothetical protein
MKLIESKTLGTAAASIEFTSIPQDGTDLLVLISGRCTRVALNGNMVLTFNNNTSSYSYRVLNGTGSGPSGYSGTNLMYVGEINGTTSTSNTFTNLSVYLPNYTAAVNKSASIDHVMENNATTGYQNIIAGLWSNTAAITSIKATDAEGTNLDTGTTISLYSITKGSDGIVTTS